MDFPSFSPDLLRISSRFCVRELLKFSFSIPPHIKTHIDNVRNIASSGLGPGRPPPPGEGQGGRQPVDRPVLPEDWDISGQSDDCDDEKLSKTLSTLNSISDIIRVRGCVY